MNILLVLVVALLLAEQRVEADYIWHDDEIPYEATASCRRGRSYYSNSVTANDTDIDVASDIDSLLDYSNKDICFYCVCSLDGKRAGCISRDPVFCEYFRIIRYPQASRNEYREIFKQDRPAYFRQLSYRLRRKMDEGIFDLMENVGKGLDDTGCVPYVSQYTDCTDANACSGCTRCGCNEEGKWDCKKVFECPQEDGTSVVDDVVLENALDVLFGLDTANTKKGPGQLVPPPPNPDEDLLLVPDKRIDIEEQLRELMGRHKRSAIDEKSNATVKFYETIDEINEDTLKKVNASGTIKAHKVNAEGILQKSQRTDIFDHNSASNISDFHIEYQPHELEHHIAENKIDSKHPTEDKINGLSHEEIHKILGNYSQIMKNKELSKLVVNELSRGAERIGDKNVVPVSNITFTPENDTLTAMTFIAGNLLNKLWDMEKDANEGSFETEMMKHEKINDLLELFKEPLSLRQESFLKNALEKLSHVIDANKDTRNMSLCANIESPETTKSDIKNCTEKSKILKTQNTFKVDSKIMTGNLEDKTRATNSAINKINDVLNLIEKYEQLQKKLKNLKGHPASIRKYTIATETNMSNDEKASLDQFGNILEKITKLLSPHNNGKRNNKRLEAYNMLRTDQIAKQNIEKIFNINLDNMTMSTKDRMITDYLSNIEKHPNCFFTHLQKPVVVPLSNTEGNILYNLSEFFKIKSFTDLLNLVNEKPDTVKLLSTISTTTTNHPTSTEESASKRTPLRTSSKSKSGSLDLAKEKLKSDIKTILQDLLDIQKQHGIKTKNNINIADAIPCLYNILKPENETSEYNPKNKKDSNSFNKIKSFIDSLKLDMKFMSSRRSNMDITPRPRSAVVWERAIKHLNEINQKASRRNLYENPKTYSELRQMMDKVELYGNTYKNFIIQAGVAPSERLILLKTLQADNKQYIQVLETIQKSLETISNLDTDKQSEFSEFVDNAAININLNKKLVDLVTKLKDNILEAVNMKPRTKARTIKDSNQPLIMIPKWVDSNENNNNFKLRRDQIMNQLIMNRLKLYIKTKERTEKDFNENANYNIAKRILFHLENGNIALAKELYKVFLANKQLKSADKFTDYQEKELLENSKRAESRGPKLIAFKEPLIRVEEPKKIKMLNHDYFLKQLWNLKELKE